MPELTTYLLALVPLAIAGLLIWLYLRKAGRAGETKEEKRAVYQGVVKKDWVVTGRIDFATQEEAGAADAETPAEFRLLVEERRIVESISGNEHLEIQWRLATLKEAKIVTAHYHKYLAQNDLVKTVAEEAPVAATPAAPTSIAAPAEVAPASAIEAPPTQTQEKPAEAETPAEPHVRMVAGGNP
jgi:hypothetical protein